MKKIKDVLKAIYHDYQYTKCLAEHKAISTDELLIIIDQYMSIIIDEVNDHEE